MTIRALIVEDEPLAIDRLRSCLAYASELDLIGEARDGAAAVEMIDRFKPDLVFLDIQLPIFSGFDVLRSVEYRPAIIFTTAHNEYPSTRNVSLLLLAASRSVAGFPMVEQPWWTG